MTGIVKIIAGISEIADCYDGFLVDLWGCVHNGTEPFPPLMPCSIFRISASEFACFLMVRGAVTC